MISSLLYLRAIRILILSFIVFSGSIQAVAGYLISEEETWIQEKNITLPTNIPAEGVSNGTYYLSLDKQLRVDEETEKNYTAVATYVANRSGVDRNSQVNIYYDPEYEAITLHSIRVIRDALVIPKLKTAKITELRTEPELSNLIYNGRTQINIILNDVRVGDIVEYRYTRKGANPVYNGNFSYTRYQEWDVSFLNQRLKLLWLKENALTVDDTRAYSALSKSLIDGGYLYEFEVKSSKVIRLDDDTPRSIDPYKRVYFTEAKSWQDIVDWSLPLYESSISQDAAILDIANNIKNKNISKSEQVSAALTYVQDNIRYFGIELGKNSHQPSHALTTLDRRYGDCKDKAVLFISILKALGIKSSPALVNTEEMSLLQIMPPMYTVFDHVIVKVELDNKVYWLDPTRIYQYGKLDDLYQPNYEVALEINKGINSLEKMNSPNNSSTKVFENFDFINEDEVSFTVRSVYKGKDAEIYYENVLSDGINELQDSYLDYYQSSFPDIEIKNDISISDYENSGVLEVIESYQFSVDIKSFDFEMLFGAYNLEEFLEEPSEVERDYSYDQYSHTHREHEIIIRLPKGKFEVDDYHYKNTNDYFDYGLNADFDKQNDILQLDFKFREKERIVELNDFDQYLEDIEESSNNTAFTLSNQNHKKVLKNGALGYTLDNLLIFSYFVLWLLSAVFLIVLVIRYFIKRNKGYYNFEDQAFYPISMKKFILMNLSTLGLFHVFWSYKNWAYIEKENERTFWKFPRSFFHNFMFYSFNNWVNKEGLDNDGSPNVYAKDIAIFIFIALVSFVIFDATKDNDFSVFLALLVIVFYSPFVIFFEKLNKKNYINYQRNSELSTFHYLFFASSLPLVLFLAIFPFNILHDKDVILGADIYDIQIEYFKNEGLIEEEEEIKMLSSSAMFDIRDNGSGFTDKAVFRYWQEDEGGFYFYSKPLSDIVEIDTKTEEEYTVLEVTFSNSDYLNLYILNSESMDDDFVKALRSEWEWTVL